MHDANVMQTADTEGKDSGVHLYPSHRRAEASSSIEP